MQVDRQTESYQTNTGRQTDRVTRHIQVDRQTESYQTYAGRRTDRELLDISR